MANTRELRRRIKSVKNTAQITKAMQMVAATKMRRAQNQAISGRPYTETLNFSLTSLLEKVNPELHPLLTGNDSPRTGVILLSTDKGLAGALNTNIIRATLNFMKTHERHPELVSGSNQQMPKQVRHDSGPREFVFFTIGKKGRQAMVKTGKDVDADFENPEKASSRQARQITKAVLDEFNAGNLGEVYLIYPDFVSALRQEPRVIKLLPIDSEQLAQMVSDSKPRETEGQAGEFLFEPDVDALLDFILTHSLETKVYQALLETKASEHSARMVAMQNATDNAKELVEDLQLAYNQTRQASITTELLEITTAAAAME